MNEQTELERLKAIETRLNDEWQRIAFLRRNILKSRMIDHEALRQYTWELHSVAGFLGYTPVEDLSDWIPPLMRKLIEAKP